MATSLAGDEDDGAPPAGDARVTVVDAAGEIVVQEEERLAEIQNAAARIAAVKQAAVTADEDTPELRRQCLDMAAKSGLTKPDDVIEAAKRYRDFVLKG